LLVKFGTPQKPDFYLRLDSYIYAPLNPSEFTTSKCSSGGTHRKGTLLDALFLILLQKVFDNDAVDDHDDEKKGSSFVLHKMLV